MQKASKELGRRQHDHKPKELTRRPPPGSAFDAEVSAGRYERFLLRAERSERNRLLIGRVLGIVESERRTPAEKVLRLLDLYKKNRGILKPSNVLLLHDSMVELLSFVPVTWRSGLHSRGLREALLEMGARGSALMNSIGRPAYIAQHLVALSLDNRLTDRHLDKELRWIGANVSGMSLVSRVQLLEVFAALNARRLASREGTYQILRKSVVRGFDRGELEFVAGPAAFKALNAFCVLERPLALKLWERMEVRQAAVKCCRSDSAQMLLYHLKYALDVPLSSDEQELVDAAVVRRRLLIGPRSDFEQDVADVALGVGASLLPARILLGYEVDALVEYRGRTVVLEASGNWCHFVNSDPRAGFRGPDLLRNANLTKAGFPILHVPGAHWGAMKRAGWGQRLALQAALDALVEIPEPTVAILGCDSKVESVPTRC